MYNLTLLTSSNNFSDNWCVIDGLHIKPDFWRGGLLRLDKKFGLGFFD